MTATFLYRIGILIQTNSQAESPLHACMEQNSVELLGREMMVFVPFKNLGYTLHKTPLLCVYSPVLKP